MYWQFKGCVQPEVIISLTVCFTFIASIIQLFFSLEGTIMTSAIMTLYCTYVCYSAIILNPNGSCNPALHSGYQTLSAAIGIVLTVISLLWATYSTVKKIPQVYAQGDGSSGVTAVNLGDITLSSTEDPYKNPLISGLLVQVSLVFLTVSGYYAMVLTNWATVQSTSSISHPRTGSAAMWIQATGQWIAILLYMWTLVAPKILSNRDFS